MAVQLAKRPGDDEAGLTPLGGKKTQTHRPIGPLEQGEEDQFAIARPVLRVQRRLRVDRGPKHFGLGRFGAGHADFPPAGDIDDFPPVGLRTIQRLSTPQQDYVKNGFYAKTLAEELKAPDMELSILQNIDDVTAQVNAAVKPGMSSAEGFAARRAAIAAVEKASQEKVGLRSEVVSLYQGALYHLYRYKIYTDVRLVFAPEFDTAFYGGDLDNFTYPRYCLDVTFFRIYENDKPARIEHYLSWSLDGTKENDAVFAAGHPGATQRLNTIAHLEYLRDAGLPWSIRLLERR